MIEGIIVTIPGTELQQLCQTRTTHHRERVTAYAQQIQSMKDNDIEGMNYSGGDPLRNLTDRMGQHEDEAREMEFIASHIDLAESYRLSRDDLSRLGICKGRGGW
ncbi:MAG: hypothetical protein ACOYOF_19320 [Verrucomicrobiaceae bacterium]|jgi:hypothetical protein